MFTQDQLQDLINFNANGDGVVSVYLDTDCSQQTAETIKLQVRGMLRELNGTYVEDAQIIERYLDHSYDWSKPGLALFSSAASDYFRAYPVAVSFRNRLRVGHKPYVKPLAHLLDHYAYFGVILVDRVGARFFEYHLGELLASEGVMGEDVRHLKKGGGSSTVGMRGGARGVQGGSRHEEEVAQRNMRDAAAASSRFFSNKPIRRLFIGGTTENVAQFRELLTKQLQSRIAGTFAMDMTAGEHEVRKQTLTMLRDYNTERESRLVESMIAGDARGAKAVTGLDDTLQAVSDKRVDTLIISDGLRVPGYVQDENGFVVANLARSPLSDLELQEVKDVIDSAVAYTIAQGGHVEVITDNADLEGAGRIGAILRY
jgi:peptide subunit release factor 1 (eRF1)